MKYSLEYDISVDDYEDYISPFSDIDIDDFEGGYYTYTIDENLEDIIGYLYYVKYNKSYENNLGWYLEDGAKEFVKDIENKYWTNTLDVFSLYHDYSFLDYLKEKYKDEAVKASFEKELTAYHFSHE